MLADYQGLTQVEVRYPKAQGGSRGRFTLHVVRSSSKGTHVVVNQVQQLCQKAGASKHQFYSAFRKVTKAGATMYKVKDQAFQDLKQASRPA